MPCARGALTMPHQERKSKSNTFLATIFNLGNDFGWYGHRMTKYMRRDSERRGQQIIINTYDTRAPITWREGGRIDKNSFSVTTALQRFRDSGLTVRLRNLCFFTMTSTTFANSLRLSKSHCHIWDIGIKIMSPHCKNQGVWTANKNMIILRITAFVKGKIWSFSNFFAVPRVCLPC